ncbi:hypothetical protein COO91_07163 [Nostoc flagelliforme CCNUN1]|uniref:Uncharacterized protein n=1 Tax=Nostoc flagelliforme CCNUN1 TaxID=2038116 RepID=A0A2K8T091_9NOSO|nr:hypothetical protein COO91_07163 [Nostoc flagelliforme CCNUN1]
MGFDLIPQPQANVVSLKRPRKAIAFPMDVKKHFCFLEEG